MTLYEGTRIYADGVRYAIGEATAITTTATGGSATFTFGGETTIPISATTSAQNEVQSIAVDATGGTFTITYAGQTTSALAFNASGATVTAALVALSNLASGDVVVTGGPGVAGGGTPYVLTFGGTLAATNVAAVTTGVGSLTGGAGTAAVTTTTIGCPAFTAANIVAAFEDLSSVGAGNISGVATSAGVVTLSFTGDLAGQDTGAITVTDSGTGGTVTVAAGSQTGPLTVERSQNVKVYGTPGAVQYITRSSTGGTFTLTYDGQETGDITAVAGVTAAAIQSALRALSNLTDDEVAVTGSNGGPFTVTFTFASNPDSVAALTVDAASATGGSVPRVAVSQQVPVWDATDGRLEWASAS